MDPTGQLHRRLKRVRLPHQSPGIQTLLTPILAQSANVQNLLRLHMGRRRLFRSSLTKSKQNEISTSHASSPAVSAYWTERSMDFPTLHHPALPSQRSHERQRINSEADGSQARDPVKGVKAKYQLAVTEEALLSVIIEIDAYKATRAKIEAYSK